ncbi:MAG: VOC family protein [Myxococcales bacterium]
MMTRLNPYLRMDGTAEQAIALYQRALGAKTEQLLRFSEMPAPGVAPEYRNRVMHAVLSVGALTFMVHDTPPGMRAAAGDNVQVCLEFNDLAELARAFDALGAGGKVCVALHDAFFGSKFGLLTDAFGVTWVLVGPPPKA